MKGKLEMHDFQTSSSTHQNCWENEMVLYYDNTTVSGYVDVISWGLIYKYEIRFTMELKAATYMQSPYKYNHFPPKNKRPTFQRGVVHH